MQRPSNKELFNKIRTGKEIVAKGNIYPINIDSIAADAIELGYQVTNLQNILISLLDEVQIDNYVGGHPPKKSYESLIKDSDLFEFKWESKRLGCDIYLKYCLKDEFFF